MSSYELLMSKLDKFVRKFYLNKLIKGSLLFVGLLLLMFVVFSSLEYNFYYSIPVRKTLFVSFILIGLGTFVYWILLPILQYLKLAKQLNHYTAADMIGSQFDDVQDKLKNILQLKDQLNTEGNNELLLASIDQKTKDIQLVPFQKAIDLTKNKKYLRYALPPVFVLVLLLIVAPYVITDGSARLIQNDQTFERPAPFKLMLLQSNKLEAQQGADFRLEVRTEGEILPEEAFIHVGGQDFQMRKEGLDKFSFVFKRVKEAVDFYVHSGPVQSESYELKVLKRPVVTDFKLHANYPAYLGRATETFEGIGDLTIPEGTNLTWTLQGENLDASYISIYETEHLFKSPDDQLFSYSKYIGRTTNYQLIYSSVDLPRSDSASYTLQVIQDAYPEIHVEAIVDSNELHTQLYTGQVSDDHGISKLELVYRITNPKKSQSQALKRKRILGNAATLASFQEMVQLDSLNLSDGDALDFYFEVWDNDGVNGSKSTKSTVYTFQMPNLEELEQKSKANAKDIQESLAESRKKAEALKQEMKELKDKFLNKKELNWQDRKELEKLSERQAELQKEMHEALEKFKENQEHQEQTQELTPELQEKQEQLEEMMEELVNEEMQKLMEEIQKLMEELNREESIEEMNEMEHDSEKMEMDLEKLESLFEKLQVEVEMQKHIDDLEKLAEEQLQQSEDTKESNKSNEELKDKQKELNDAFEKLQEALEDTKEKNEALDKPNELDDTEELEEEIKEDQEDSMEEMEQQNNQKASEKQKGAGKKMKQMANQMKANMQASSSDQAGEDLKTIRQLLENVLTLSFQEEDLINNLNRANKYTPYYVELIQEQFVIKDDFKVVKDTLQALAKRNIKMESFLMEKATEISKDLDKGLDLLEERKNAVVPQRLVMKNLNDLALMLEESMEQMQQAMANQMPGEQMCNNPKKSGKGQGKKMMDKITEGQQSLQEILKEMQGRKQGKEGKPLESKDFGEAAKKQAELRKLMKELADQRSQSGKNAALMQEILKAMNEMERDLVNKKLGNQTMKRQHEIMTRLLEAKKAEEKREFEEAREAQTAQPKQAEIPAKIEQYIQETKSNFKPLDKSVPSLQPYYKSLVDNYYKTLNN